MDLKRKLLTCLAIVSLVVGVFAVAGNSAVSKKFSLVAPTSVSSSDLSIPITITNAVPSGNSNINSLYITVTGSVVITGASPGSAVVSDSGHKVAITGISSIKPTQTRIFTLNVNMDPNPGCSSTSLLTWGGVAYAGNSLSGDKFTLLGSPPSQLSTTITENYCATITVTKYNDGNFNGTRDEGEATLQGWVFTLSGNDDSVNETTDDGGTATFTVPAGTGPYDLCESLPEGGSWLNTGPGANGCDTIAQSETTPGAQIVREFGNFDASDSSPLGCGDTMDVSGEQSGTSLIGQRIGNVESSCEPIPYRFSPNDQGGFTFVKDVSTQPDAQFIITQSIELPIATDVSANPFEANTINGYTTEISYDGGQSYQPVPLCPSVQRDEGGNATGASLPDGMTTGYCITDQNAAYGSPGDGMVTITTTFYGLGDPITRTKPI